jgi:hypothetical protein
MTDLNITEVLLIIAGVPLSALVIIALANKKKSRP